jgi:hypothetical protein
MSSHDCPRCGAPLPPPTGRGRPRIWCSGACRMRAATERAAAARGVIAIKAVEVRRETVRETQRPVTAGQAADIVLADPQALVRVLATLVRRHARGTLPPETAEALRPHVHDLAAKLTGTRFPGAPAPAPTPGGHEAHTAAVLDSPRATVEVLRGLLDLARKDAFAHPRYSRVAGQVSALARELLHRRQLP